jgi:hypothetical protein
MRNQTFAAWVLVGHAVGLWLIAGLNDAAARTIFLAVVFFAWAWIESYKERRNTRRNQP